MSGGVPSRPASAVTTPVDASRVRRSGGAAPRRSTGSRPRGGGRRGRARGGRRSAASESESGSASRTAPSSESVSVAAVGVGTGVGVGVGVGVGAGGLSTLSSPRSVAWRRYPDGRCRCCRAARAARSPSTMSPVPIAAPAWRRRRDDDPERSGAVVDRDAEAVGQRRRRLGDGARDARAEGPRTASSAPPVVAPSGVGQGHCAARESTIGVASTLRSAG